MAKKTFEINGTSLSLDLLDADENERVQKARDTALAKINAPQEDATEAEKIRTLCDAVRGCFDDAFGAGTGAAICGISDKLDVCVDAYVRLCDACKKLGDTYVSATERRVAKMQPAPKDQ